MLTLLIKFIQSLVKSLHSEGTPGQVALGVALGACLGLTPLMTLHNLIIFAAIVLLNVSFAGARIQPGQFLYSDTNGVVVAGRKLDVEF